MPIWAWLSPFILQGVVMSADELIYHRRRGLGRWERIGHPLDTLSVILALGWLMLRPPSTSATYGFGVLAVISCLLITKDEWVHRELCTAEEHWLHAILFILHPVVFYAAWKVWPVFHQGESGGLLLPVQFAASLAWFFYQNIYWKGRDVRR